MITLDNRFILNHVNSSAFKAQLGALVHHTQNLLPAYYDFSKQGGAVGDINLVDSDGNARVIPSGFIIQRVLIDVVTAPTSGGSATLALKVVNSADILTATAKASFTGLLDGIPVSSAATSIKLAADKTPKLTVGTAALTAGKFTVYFIGIQTV